MTFDRRVNSSSGSHATHTKLTNGRQPHHGYGLPNTTGDSNGKDNDGLEDNSDENSDSTPLTRPSATTTDIADIVAQALARERANLDNRIAELERQQQEFQEKTSLWEQKLLDMRKQIVDATVHGTINVLTGNSSPFMTKTVAHQQHKETAAELQSLKESMEASNNGVLVLQQHMTILLQRTEQLFAAHHDPTVPSPPRKARATTPLPADSPMADVEGVGEE